MTQFEEQLRKQTSAVRLNESERLRMREHLTTYMEYKPLRKKLSVRRVASAFNMFSFFRAHHLSGALIIALVTSSFGMTFAAADALPGDLLYTVKVDVNEAVVGAFIANEEKQIAWERERAERRLEEASQLAAEGRLDTGRKDEVARRFAQHTDTVVKKVLSVETDDPVLAAEMSTEFEAALETHEVVLARLLVEGEEETTDEAKELVGQVRTVTMRVSEIADDAEEKIERALEVEEAEEPQGETSEANVSETAPEVANEDEAVQGVDSANMRVRAAYRTQERALEHLASAEAEMAKLDAESEIYIHATTQINSSRALLEEGTGALENNDYKNAYNAFRAAASALQKVSQLLKASTLFNVSILEGVDASREDSDQEVSTEEGGEKAEENTELLLLRDEVSATIDKVKARLLTHEGYAEQDVTRANSFVKDAMAHVLRGEIAIVLEQHSKARGLLGNAQRLAENAMTVVENAQVTDVVEQPQDTEDTADQTETIDNTEIQTMPPLPEPNIPRLDVVTVYDDFEEGVHTYSGVFYTPTPCFALAAEALVAESYPEQVTLELRTVDEGGDCPMVIDRKAFSLKVSASAEAQVTSVMINDTVSKFEVVPGKNTELFEDPAVIPVRLNEDSTEAPSESSVETPEGDNPNMLERALNATTDLLR